MSEIGDVSVGVELNTAGAVAKSKVSGEAIGQGLSSGIDKGFTGDFEKKLNQSLNNPKLRKLFNDAGKNLGSDFGNGFRGINKDLLGDINSNINSPKLRAQFSKAGRNLGTDFGDGFRGVNKDFLDDINANLNNPKIRAAFNKAGTDSGEAFAEARTVEMRRGNTRDERDSRSFLDRITKLFRDKGGDAGDGFGSGFLAGFRRSFSRISSIIVGVTAVFGETLTVGLTGATGAITSLVGSLLNAGAAGLALIPIIAGLGATVATAFIGFAGFGTALSEVNEGLAQLASGEIDAAEYMEILNNALSSLSPSAAEVVKLFADLRPALGDFQDVIQERLFSGLADDLAGFAEQLPQFQEAFGAFADVLNSFFSGIINIAANADLPSLFAGLAPAVDSVLDGVRNLTSAFFSFLEGATPAAGRLGAIFQGWTSEFSKFIERIAGDGTLDEFLDRAIDSFQEWADLIGSTGQLLGTIFSAGLETGDGFVSKLTEIIDKFNEFLNTSDGQEGLTTFFETAESIMSSLGTVLSGVAAGIKNLIDPATVDRFDVLAESLAIVFEVLGSVLNVLGDAQVLTTFAEAIGMIALAIDDLLPVFQPLADAVGEFLQSGLQSLAPVLEAIAGISAVVIPYFVTFIDTLRESGVVETFSNILVFLAETAAQFLDALGDAGILDLFADLIVTAAEAVAELLEAVSPLIAPLLSLVRTVLPPLIKAFKQVVDSGIDIILAVFEALVPIVVLLVEAFAPLIEELLPVLADAISLLLENLEPLIAALGEALFEALEALLPLLPPLLDAFIQLLPAFVELSTALLPVAVLFLELVGPIAEVAAMFIAVLIPAIDGISDAMDGLVGILTTVRDTVLGFVDDVIGFFQDLYDTLVGNSIIPDLINGIVDWFLELPAQIIGIVATFLADLVTSFANFAVDVLSGIGTWVRDMVIKAGDLVRDFTSKIANFVSDIPTKFTNMISDIAGQIGLFVVRLVLKAAELARDFAGKIEEGVRIVVNWFRGLPQRAIDAVSGVASWLVDLGRDIIGWIVDGIESAAGSVADAIRAAIPGGGFFRNLLPYGLGNGFGEFTGLARGGVFNSAVPAVIGEAGAEAVVPLVRPLNQVDPSVRAMAALIRGATSDPAYPRGAPVVASSSPVTHHHNWNIQGTDDPEAQAHKIMNRLVAAL